MNWEVAQTLLTTMWRIRGVEEAIARRYPAGRMRCPVHLSIGQEAVPAAVAACVRRDDYAVSTHRGHAHYLAKGGDLAAMIAELHGKASGCAGGRGGSMHLIDPAVGFMGTSAIVGNSIPVGVGLALALQARGGDAVSLVFLGDGAVEEGVFYESVNFAVVRKLPVIFVCENNLYSVYSPMAVRQPEQPGIAARVGGLGIAAYSGDGNDALACLEVLQAAFARVRGGDGPAFVEFSTYRWREHCGPHYDNDLGYRSVAEFEDWQGRDPVVALERTLSAAMAGDWDGWRRDTRAALADECEAAFAAADAAPFPEAATAYVGEYATS